MGASESQEEKEKREREESVFDPRYISWDEKGNLRYGLVHPVKRSEQLKEILKKDFVDDEDGKTWYVVESAWIASWLAYVKFDRKAAPAPGPCDNRRLIVYDAESKAWVGRPGLIMARKDFGGDYRRVSKEVWELFCSFYPNSGPSITMVFNASEKNEKGFYDTSKWQILDPPPAPDDGTGKKKKKKIFDIGLKGKGKGKEGEEGEEKKEEKREVESSSERSISVMSTMGEDPKQSTLGNMPNVYADNTTRPGGEAEQTYEADSDDDIDLAPLNSFSGKTKNDPKVVGLNVNYTKIADKRTETSTRREQPTPKSDAFIESVYFSKD